MEGISEWEVPAVEGCRHRLGVGADGQYYCMDCMLRFKSLNARIYTEFHFGGLELSYEWDRLVTRKRMVLKNLREGRPPFFKELKPEPLKKYRRRGGTF
jgi:hypothetical protein